ncbi:piwi-like protein Siwi [Chrysoperla carnea]|uniref:piwi-like protein Siwi n=1 Tax=Chrysoperla carnea TaxID=189513 RepID=UPI001D091300|nr:piwi-like protein Siwi [Chrysoperla carnea]
MSDQRPRGRGRGRGGDKGGQPPQQRGPPQSAAGGPAQQRGPPASQGAWGAGRPQQQSAPAPQGAWSAGRPQQGPTGQGAWGGGRPQQAPQGPPAPGASWGPRPGGTGAAPQPRPTGTQTTAGRATHRQAAVERITEQVGRMETGSARGSGEPDAGTMGSGRGATRGRRNVAVDILRTRPISVTTKSGSTGEAIRLQTNYYELLSTPDWKLFEYSVTFDPSEDRLDFRRKMMRVHEKTLGGGGYIFTGGNLYTTHRLGKDILEVFSDHPVEEKPIRITLKLSQELPPTSHQYLQLFNSLIRNCLRFLKLQLVGRNYFDAKASVDIRDHRMELWPGYVTSIRQHETTILMCSEITHKVMRRDTVLDFLKECYHRDAKEARQLFEKGIIGAVVLTDYNNRTYRIDDVDWENSPSSTFKLRTNEEISYAEYFKKKYQKNIVDMRQPMLISKAKPREIRMNMADLIYLVPELCRMTGLTDSQRANFTLMRTLSEYTRVAPDNRIQKLQEFSQRLLKNSDITNLFRQWDLKLSNALVEVAGRVLPPETICAGNQVKFSAGPNADFTKELRANPMHIIAPVNQWICVCPSMLKNEAFNFVKMIVRASAGMSFNIPTPKLHEIQNDSVPNYLEALEQAINNHKPQMLLCIVTNNKLDRYSAIKKKCCVDRPVPTQVIVAKTLRNKGAMSIATKVAIQINCKLGGAAWGAENPLGGLMVVGFDVYHDTMNKDRSFGAMVASMNRSCSQYYSTCTPHTQGTELSNDFALNMERAVMKYNEINKKLPDRILIYRDGVGDGQIPFVYEHELTLIKQTLSKIYGENPVRMAFIIVSKRINTRFFYTPPNKNPENPPPGTVVDNVITLPERYDFFIVSQSVKQGTVSPTSYNVINDTSGLDPDKIQRLTYKLCHMYFNWSGTVRVPAPCQYAHKLAFLAGSSLHRSPSPQLATTLYYL